jgi:histidyl-tRNA synthetase
LSPSRFCAAADDVPRVRGAYVLLIETSAPVAVSIARARCKLTSGRYLYCGSANGPGGLHARLARHMRREKAVRWHVDQLTTRGIVRGAWIFPEGDECALVARLAHLPTPIPGFGSSDCRRCRSHLLHWPDGAALPFDRR